MVVSISPRARNSLSEFSNVIFDDSGDDSEWLLFAAGSSKIGEVDEDQRIFGMSTRTSMT